MYLYKVEKHDFGKVVFLIEVDDVEVESLTTESTGQVKVCADSKVYELLDMYGYLVLCENIEEFMGE